MNLLFLDITQVSKSVVFLADGLLTYTLLAYYLTRGVSPDKAKFFQPLIIGNQYNFTLILPHQKVEKPL